MPVTAAPAIAHPRRLLLVGAPHSGKLTLLRALTGSLPTALDSAPTHAGLSHTVALSTAYYTAAVPVWVDEVGATPDATADWGAAWTTAEAKEVLGVLGAFVLCFRKPRTADHVEAVERMLRALGDVVRACGYAWDGVCLAVAMPASNTTVGSTPPTTATGGDAEEWDERCRGFGFEYVDYEARGRNDFGEPVGIDRVREALEANDWGGGDGDDDGEAALAEFEEILAAGDAGEAGGSGGGGRDGEDGEKEEEDSMKSIGDETEREMFGLHRAIVGAEDGDEDGDDGDDDEVGKLEATLAKLQALKDLGEDVPHEERRKLAAKALSEIMKS